MAKVENRDEIAILLKQLINYFKNNKLENKDGKSYKSQIFSIQTRLEKIAEYQNSQLKSEVGNGYKKSEFKVITESDCKSLGSSSVDIGMDNNKFVKSDNHLIKVYLNNFEEMLKSEDVEDRVFACMKMCDTVLHEFQHYRQVCNKEKYELDGEAIQFAKQDIVRRNVKGLYQENYEDFSHEIDARLASYDMTMQILDTINSQKLKEIFASKRYSSLDELRENVAFITEKGGYSFTESKAYFTNKADEIIREHPEILDIYKSLRFEYNKDGTPKSNVQLITQMRNCSNQIRQRQDITNEQKKVLIVKNRNSYFDILENRIYELNSQEARKLQQTFGIEGTGGTKELYELMKEYYNGKHQKKIEDYNRMNGILEHDEAQLKEKMLQGLTGKEQEEAKQQLETILMSKKNIEMQKQIVHEKFSRIIARSADLKSEEKYVANKKIINGVDLPNIDFDLSNEQKRLDSKVATGLISAYEKLETDKDFNFRSNNENKNISLVINTVETGRCYTGFAKVFEKESNTCFTQSQIKTMMRALKAAQALTVTGGRDYLNEFISSQFVSGILEDMAKDKTAIAMREQAKRIEQYTPKQTLADKDRNEAEEHLSSSNLKKESPKKEIEYYGRQGATSYRGSTMNKWDRTKLAIWRLTARQQGFICGDLSEPDANGIRTLGLKSRNSQLINTEDLERFAKSDLIVDCIVNGKKYEVMDKVKVIGEEGR